MSLNSETDACIYFHELVTAKIMAASSVRHNFFYISTKYCINTQHEIGGKNMKTSHHQFLKIWVLPITFVESRCSVFFFNFRGLIGWFFSLKYFFPIGYWMFVTFFSRSFLFKKIPQMVNWLFVILRHKIPFLCKTVRPCIELLLIDIFLSRKYQISKMDTKSNIGLQMCQKKQMLQHHRVQY